jgi:hypothetical protein
VWEALKKKYDTKEVGAKKYGVSCYLKYQMVNEKPVETKSHEIQKIAPLVQKYLYRKVFKSVGLATRLNKSRSGNPINICNVVRSVAFRTNLTKVK